MRVVSIFSFKVNSLQESEQTYFPKCWLSSLTIETLGCCKFSCICIEKNVFIACFMVTFELRTKSLYIAPTQDAQHKTRLCVSYLCIIWTYFRVVCWTECWNDTTKHGKSSISNIWWNLMKHVHKSSSTSHLRGKWNLVSPPPGLKIKN